MCIRDSNDGRTPRSRPCAGFLADGRAMARSGKRILFGGQTNSPERDLSMSFKVRIVKADRTIEVPTGATILWSALDSGVDYPFGCQSGNCGACKSYLVSGEVTMEGYSEF